MDPTGAASARTPNPLPTATGVRRRGRLLGVAIAALVALTATAADAQSTKWDSMLSNSRWYVPEENLLSYMTSATNFLTPAPFLTTAPSPGSDQTLWSLGTATNGVFSGTAVATFRPASAPVVANTNTNAIVSGIVTDTGQLRMVFQGLSSGQQTIGIGQVRTISGTNVMEMQMITGNSSVLTTHWASMAPYDPGTFTPPTLFADGTLLSQGWRWTEGSTWLLHSDTLFGLGGSGTFTITDYRDGYFWGPGSGPTARRRRATRSSGRSPPKATCCSTSSSVARSRASPAGSPAPAGTRGWCSAPTTARRSARRGWRRCSSSPSRRCG
jgi:hypothetical protein